MTARRQDVRFGRRIVSAGGTLLFCVLLVACGGGSETVARVGDERITEDDVEAMVEFYAEEAEREGREVPAEGSEARRGVERRLLGLIVFRRQLEEAAAEEFGIELSEDEVEERVERSAEAEQEGEEGESGGFIENAVRIQLVKEKVAAELGGIEALNNWLAKVVETVPVEYEEGWNP